RAQEPPGHGLAPVLGGQAAQVTSVGGTLDIDPRHTFILAGQPVERGASIRTGGELSPSVSPGRACPAPRTAWCGPIAGASRARRRSGGAVAARGGPHPPGRRRPARRGGRAGGRASPAGEAAPGSRGSPSRRAASSRLADAAAGRPSRYSHGTSRASGRRAAGVPPSSGGQAGGGGGRGG